MDPFKLQEHIRENPLWFHREVLGIDPWGKQIDIIESVKNHRNTAVRSCNGGGKTFILPRIALWFLYAFPESVVINTAPTHRQMEFQYWRNFREAYNVARYPLGGTLLKTRFDIDENWFALGVSSSEHSVEKFQGWHAKHILIIFDEAPGVSPAIYDATVGALSGGETVRFVLIGNPTQNSGQFYDAFTDPTFNKIHISAFDIPNVIQKKQVVPGLSTWEWVEETRQKYGEDSDIYRVRVLGEFPNQSSDTLIAISLIENAFDAEREKYGDSEIIGVDVARFGDDSSAFVYRKGNYAKVLEVIQGNDTMQIAGKTKNYLKEYPHAKAAIDVIGVGAGVYDRLKEQDDVSERITGVNFASQARETEEYANVRAESWGTVKNWLKDAILDKHEGFYQLAQPKYKINSRGQIILEPKEDMKKRGVKSPDVGDALAMTLARATEGDNLGVMWI